LQFGSELRGFLTFSQQSARPKRYSDPRRFETMRVIGFVLANRYAAASLSGLGN